MNQKLSGIKHSARMMWGCAAIVVAAVILALVTNAYALLFVIPCMAMMGAMMWLMMGGMGGGTTGSKPR